MPRAHSQSKSAGAFDELRTLSGQWEATTQDERKFTTRIRAVSNGTALEETFDCPPDSETVTLCTPDGGRAARTRHCSMGNQPGMEAAALESGAKRFEFTFIGATNLASPSDTHMHHVVLEVVDNDHFSETWTMSSGGKERTETFSLRSQGLTRKFA